MWWFILPIALLVSVPRTTLADGDDHSAFVSGDDVLKYFEVGRRMTGQNGFAIAVNTYAQQYQQQRIIAQQYQLALQSQIALQQYQQQQLAYQQELYRQEFYRIRNFANPYITAMASLGKSSDSWSTMLESNGLDWDGVGAIQGDLSNCEATLRGIDPGSDRVMQQIQNETLKTMAQYRKEFQHFREIREGVFDTVPWIRFYANMRWKLERQNVLAGFNRVKQMANENARRFFAFVQAHPNEFSDEERAHYR